jgi:benzoyl-CoA-dihydrodiol lyase
MIDFQTDPSRYRHWRLSFDGPVATLTMDVDPDASLFEGCELKLNSYDLGVDIELADAVQRLRFEHPEVRCVVLRSGKPGVFCAGANIRMLAKASHGHKVNFCKFTNETRLAIEDASANSGQAWLAAVSGSAAGGGYELAMAAEHIMLIDDHRSGVSLPELPLLGVLPATGGLTRLTDKRMVRRDRADVFCTTEEGVRGRRAVEWRLRRRARRRHGRRSCASAPPWRRCRPNPADAQGIADAAARSSRIGGTYSQVRDVGSCGEPGRYHRDGSARRDALAARGGARAGRRHPASTAERADPGADRASISRRPGRGIGSGRDAGGAQG